MRWKQDDDNADIHLLIGQDLDGEPIELGRVEPGHRKPFWNWASSYAMGAGGADSLEGCKSFLIRSIKETSLILKQNLGN
jgi:hypothetical protein